MDELVRHEARQMIQPAIEAEPLGPPERFASVETLHEQRAVARNGYLPERGVSTAAGPNPVQVPKIREPSGSGVASAR